jgi:hypothetical protein
MVEYNFGDPLFENIDLSFHEQTYIRGKPKKYLLKAIELFEQLPSHKTILEIGSVYSRMSHDIDEFNPECCNAGHSTYFWKKYTDADIYTVDINPGCKSVVDDDIRLQGVNAVTSDAISYAKTFDKKIDLLFLDAWDVHPMIDYAEKHLEIYTVLKGKLSDSCMILIDDTDVGNGGKGRLLIPEIKKDGFTCVFSGRQTLFMRNTPSIKNPTDEFDIVIPVGIKDI